MNPDAASAKHGPLAAPEVLGRARHGIEPALRAAIDSLEPAIAEMAAYHFGWIDENLRPVTSRSGKGVRPALVFLGSEAVAGSDGRTATEGRESTAGHHDAVVEAAVAVELVHNFSLIHDDIMDADTTRHHRRTVWDVFGVGDAILVGDALHTLALQVLYRSADIRVQRDAVPVLLQATADMIAGQAQDTALNRAGEVTLEQCLDMERRKTGALLSAALVMGGIVGGGSAEQLAALEDFARNLGVAFQAVDDILGIWGDPGVTGKPVGNDLRERKKSMPIAVAFDAGGTLADDVRRSFLTAPTSAEIVSLASTLQAAGVRSQVEVLAQEHLQRGLAALQSAELNARAKAELVELAYFVVNRKL